MYRMMIIRLLWMIPALIIVSIIAFFLSRSIPGDPVETLLPDSNEGFQVTSNYLERQKSYESTARILGLDRPLFYFSIHSYVLPDTLYRILRKDERDAAAKLALRIGDWKKVNEFRASIFNIIKQEGNFKSQSYPNVQQQMQNDLTFLLLDDNPTLISEKLNNIEKSKAPVDSSIFNHPDWRSLITSAENMLTAEKTFSWLPMFTWNGIKNQYHQWFSNVIKGNFGLSVRDSKPVFAKVKDALQWTLLLNGSALLLAFLIAIPLGVWLSATERKKRAGWIEAFLFVLYAIPSFWLATIVVVLFTTPEYGVWLDLFPTQGLGPYRDAHTWLTKFGILTHHLFLPVFCLTVGSLAYISQQMRQSLSHELRSDYYLFFRSFGMKKSHAIWRQSFRNSLFPMITILGGAVPVLFSGSLIIEVIFNIPGMGRLMYSSIIEKDWNVVFGVLLMVSAITMISYLLTDIAYQIADPRIRSDKQIKKISL